MKLKLDLHEIYNRGEDIDRALRSVIEEAIEKRVRLVEIIPGKGSGQLKKRVLRFLDQKDIKALYDRVGKDSHKFRASVRPLPTEVGKHRLRFSIHGGMPAGSPVSSSVRFKRPPAPSLSR